MKGDFSTSRVSRFYSLLSIFIIISLLLSSLPPLTSQALARTLPVAPTVTPASLDFAPVANDDAYSVDQGGTLAVIVPGVLSNDTDEDTDPLTLALCGRPIIRW